MKIFIDTSPFIYLVEKDKGYARPIQNFISSQLLAGYELITSVISIAEFDVLPIRNGRLDLISSFASFISETSIKVHPIGLETARKSAELRSKIRKLKGMDSLQLASALENNCGLFLTNDKGLENIAEINIKLVKDL